MRLKFRSVSVAPIIFGFVLGSLLQIFAAQVCWAQEKQTAESENSIEDPGSEQSEKLKLEFDGIEFLHRNSEGNLHEFTPADQEDLEAWTDMLSVIVYPDVEDGDDLAEIANRVLGLYKGNGDILRTNSIRRTDEKPAEHFIAAVLAGNEFIESALARFVLVDGTGIGLVRSRRAYGDSAEEVGVWIKENGPKTEETLMDWDGFPPLADLEALSKK